MITIYRDKEFGDIRINKSKRAKLASLRIKEGHLVATIPYGVKEETVSRMIDTMRDKIRTLLAKQSIKRTYRDGVIFHSEWMTVNLTAHDSNRYMMQGNDGVYTIRRPRGNIQDDYIKDMLYTCMRHRARQVLPQLLKEVADRHGFQYTTLKINSSKGRWGSCSTIKGINLSISNMILPKHLTEYVILHELCHTVYMNHGSDFKTLLNRLSNGKMAEYDKELKRYSTFI